MGGPFSAVVVAHEGGWGGAEVGRSLERAGSEVRRAGSEGAGGFAAISLRSSLSQLCVWSRLTWCLLWLQGLHRRLRPRPGGEGWEGRSEPARWARRDSWAGEKQGKKGGKEGKKGKKGDKDEKDEDEKGKKGSKKT